MDHWVFSLWIYPGSENNRSFRSSRLEKLIQLSRQELQLKKEESSQMIGVNRSIRLVRSVHSFFGLIG